VQARVPRLPAPPAAAALGAPASRKPTASAPLAEGEEGTAWHTAAPSPPLPLLQAGSAGVAASSSAPAASASAHVTVTASPREGGSGRRTAKGVRSTGKLAVSARGVALESAAPEGRRGGDSVRAGAAQPSARAAQE
jgi:hypothetical protein